MALDKDKNVRRLAFRIHLNDEKLFMKLLDDDNITYQFFADACAQAYLRGDRSILKVLKDWKDLTTVPVEHRELYTLSHRERSLIQKELDEIQAEQDIKPNKKNGE